MIRRAEIKDVDKILDLLHQVLKVHHDIRPDIFLENGSKYTKEELVDIIKNNKKTIFVYDDNGVLGYAICDENDFTNTSNTNPIKTLYIDDFVVDEKNRGNHIGTTIYSYVKEYAKNNGFFNITLNVWEGNDAIKFYKKVGLKIQKYGMEEVL